MNSSVDGMSIGMGTPLLDHFNLLKPADADKSVPQAPKIKGIFSALNAA